MLFWIDRLLWCIPSRIVNWLTCGPEGSSMCARLWLHYHYGKGGYPTLILITIIDAIEKEHCYTSARLWRKRVWVKKEVTYPPEYKLFFDPENMT